MFRLIVAWLALSFLAGCGCGGITRPSTSDLVLSGTVSQTSGMGAGDVLSGAEVRASVDRNRDGKIDSAESVSATTDELGMYRLQMKVDPGERVVVRFSSSNTAPLLKTVVASPWAELPLNATLREMDSLSCDDTTGRCSLDGDRLSLGGLRSDLNGSARQFNPVKETRAFPGGFGDSDGNLLISGVFGAVQLEDGSGSTVENLDTQADLRMRVPRETWSQIVDITPGDDRVQVPLYAFNEASGQWIRDGEGFLETPAGALISEAQLSSIRSGAFTDGLMASGKVSHFSYWNVDWPVDTKQCLRGIVLTDDGKPAEGATVFASGVTYTGTSEAITVGSDGAFCVEVMRSEAAGESVDNDDALGETQTVRLRIAYGGKLYEGGEHEVPSTPATCGAGGCRDVGDVKLTTSSELVASVCKMKGRVLSGKGEPLPDVALFFSDPSVPQEVTEELCGFAGLNCSFLSMSGADGRYELKTPVLDGATIVALANQEDETLGISYLRLGMIETDGCPPESVDVDVVMTDGFASVSFTPSVSGQQISWSPARNISALWVTGGAGDLKWMIEAKGPEGFGTPVTYGVVPSSAEQGSPASGPPTLPIASGDNVLIMLSGEIEGMPLVGSGTVTVP